MKIVATMIMMLTGIIAAFGEIKADLLFSYDDGKTWTEDFPILKSGQKNFSVKVNYRVEETRKISRNTIMAFLYADFDFSSATGRKQAWEEINGKVKYGGKHFFWRQVIPKYYQNCTPPSTFVFNVNVDARKEGVMGVANQWNAEKKKEENAPMPAVDALKPGTHRFFIQLHYSLESPSATIICNKPFELIVEE